MRASQNICEARIWFRASLVAPKIPTAGTVISSLSRHQFPKNPFLSSSYQTEDSITKTAAFLQDLQQART